MDAVSGFDNLMEISYLAFGGNDTIRQRNGLTERDATGLETSEACNKTASVGFGFYAKSQTDAETRRGKGA